MESLYNISIEAGEFADSPAMQLIRRGREEAWAEARKQAEVEAQKTIAEERKKVETERKAVISKMIAAGIQKTMIADFLGFTLEKLESYIHEIEEEKIKKTKKSKEK